MTSGRVTIDNVGYKLLSGNRLHLLNTIGDVQLKDKDGDIVPVDEEFYVTLQDGEAYFIVEKSKRLSVDSTERKKVLKKSNGSAKNLIRSQSSGDLAKKVKSKSADELFNKETQEKLKDNSDIKEKKKIQLSLSLIDTNLNSSSTSLELSTTSSPSLSPMEPPETKKPKKTKPKSEKKSKDDQINSVRITPLSKSGRSFFGSESNIFKSVESERKIGRHEKSYSSDATYLKKGKKKKKVNYSAEKMAQAAITIQSAYRSYLVRKKMFSTSEKIKLVLLELYDKEKSYIEKLDVLLNNYHLPLLERVKSSEVIFDIEQITLMFRDIQIIRDIHSQIFLRLQKKVKSWRPLIRIDDVFVDMLQLLQGSYESYSTQYSDIITLIRLGTENQRIANFFALCKSTSKLRLNIQDLLIMPIQQFPHYLTLIERLVKNTPTSHPGHYHLKVLLKEITKIAGHLDSKIKEANNRHKVYGFQDSILNGPILAKGTRTFVREQSFPILIKNERTMRHFVLFNDALLCLKLTKKKDQPYEFDWMYDLLELTVEEIRADVKGSNYESPKIISKKMKDLEAKFLPDSSPTSPNLQDFRRSLKHRMNSPVQEFESLETLYQLNKGKSGFQITCTQNSKIESQTIIAEDELTRTSWVDEIQKCISLCGPNNSSIQQSSGKILTWHIKKKESKKGVEMEHMFFTIEQVSLNRLPSKNDPKVIRVLWASEAIYINALDIRSPMYLVLSEHALICAILPYATSEVQEYLLKWTIPLQKLNFEIIPELVTQGNENINLETLKLKISETQKKLEVEQRILGATQKMSSGNNSKLHSMSMKTASSKSAEKISNIKRELKNLQRQHTTSDAHYGLTLSGDSDEIHKFVFHSLETRQVFISTLEQLKQESLQRLITIKKSAGTERKRSNSLVSDVSTTEQIIVHKSFPTESNLMERPMSVSQDSPDLFYSFRSSSPTESFMTYNSADMYRSSTIRSNYTMNSNYTMSSTDSFELTPSPMSDYSDNYNEKKELYIAKENHKPKSEDDLVLVAGEEIDILKKSSKARWCGKKQDLVGLVNPKRLLELTKYGIFSPPKLDQIEKYVSISSRISDKEDFLSFGPGDEIHVIIKDLQLSSSELDETNSQQKPKDKTVLWFAKCGNKVGILFISLQSRIIKCSINSSPSDPDLEYEIYNISAGEWAVIGIGTVFHFVNLCGLAYVLYNRKYPPLKIKQLEVVTLNLISAIIWWIGAMSSLRILPQVENPVFLECSLWGIWVQLVFGIWLWICLHIFRLWKLFVIVKLKRSTSGYRFYLSFLIFWGPGLFYGIITSIFKAYGPLDYEGYYQCHFMDPATYSILALLAFYALCILYFIFAIRSVSHNHFREYREVRNLLGFLIISYVVYSVIVGLDYNRVLWGRCVATIIIIFDGTFSFWFVVGIPMYHCIFHHDKMLKQFHNNYFDGSRSEDIELT